MKLKFKNLDKFIEEYYRSFLNLEVFVSFSNNSFNILVKNINISFGIVILDKFYCDPGIKLITIKNFNEYTIKMLGYLNNNIDIPIAYKLGKKLPSFKSRCIFIVGTDGNIGNISKNNLKLFNSAKIFFTNNLESTKLLLNELGLQKKEVLRFSEVYNLKFQKIDEIVLLYFGDSFTNNQELNKLNFLLGEHFDKIYIEPYYSDFINKYSLSHINYGSLLYLGLYNESMYVVNSLKIINKTINFIEYTNKIININSIGSMIALSGLSIEFNSFTVLKNYILDIKNILNENYNSLVELFFETKDGYYNIIDYISKIDIDKINGEINISDITIFIYPKVSDNFIGYNKFNAYYNSKTFTFLSSPLSNIGEFTKSTILELNKSKYIFCETLEGAQNHFKNLNISYLDKKLFYGDDIKLVKKYIEENNFKNTNRRDIEFIKDIFKDLINILNSNQKIYFLTDGGTPCILDPGDYIKKFINYYYKEYSIIGIKGSSVIPTVLLGCRFEYKYIYWAPFLYTILPHIKFLKEINYFSETNFKDTLIIFYSFGNEVKNDIKKMKKLFAKSTKIQIIGDIGTEKEYNKTFLNISLINEDDFTYVEKNIKNIVYLLIY